jgi:hypothetical protein
MEDSVTLEAHNLAHGPRQSVYGHPLDNFTLTSKLWSAILNTEVTAEQVGLMMIALKMARLLNTPGHRDSLVDIAGYAEALDLIAQRRATP